MQAKSFHISVQGASHIKKNKECQDASRSFCDENLAIAIVCDGHGGSDYVRSADGSRLAAEITEQNIKDFVASVDKDELRRHTDQLIAKLESSIIGNWNLAVNEHCDQNPFTPEEIQTLSEKAKKKYLTDKQIESAYGTTVIAVAVTPDYWFGIHIGDGKCVAVNPDGRFLQPIPWDEKCFLNATTSICDSRALENFRHFYAEKLPVAVFVGSDGVDDCFQNDQQLNHLYKTVLYSFATSEFDTALSDFREYLPRLSAKGSGDDVSVAAILDLDMIGEIDVVKEFDREKEKARVEENARLEALRAEEERKRIEAEHKRAEEERRRAEEERRRAEEERRRAEEKRKLMEAERRRAEEKQRRIEAERRLAAEEQKRTTAERAKMAATEQAKKYAELAVRSAQEAKRAVEAVRQELGLGQPLPGEKTDSVPPVFCKQCGSELSPGSKFCSECGAKVEQPEAQTASEETVNTDAAEPERSAVDVPKAPPAPAEPEPAVQVQELPDVRTEKEAPVGGQQVISAARELAEVLLQADEPPAAAAEEELPVSEETVLSAEEPEPEAETASEPEATSEAETDSEDSM